MKSRYVVAFAWAGWVLITGSARADRYQLEFQPEPARVVARHVPAEVGKQATTNAEGAAPLAVFTVVNGKVAPTALLGDCEYEEGTLTFVPRYPLRPGLTYRAILRVPSVESGAVELRQDFTIPAPSTLAPRLTALYPTTEVVPENLLKFYLHFSAPMSRGEVYNRVRLFDEAGKQVEHPFLELSEELWSPDGKRLTLYFDPGRIKRGLKPREIFGPALLEAKTYTLRIDAAWPDAEGRPLQESVQKTLRVQAPDDVQPGMQRWKLRLPPVATQDPLVVVFDEPLDSAMLLRVLSVRDAQGESVAGTIALGKEEREWRFTPSVAWKAGKYSLVAEQTLEDLAGNSLGRPFEVDVFRPALTSTAEPVASLPFSIAP